MTPKYFIMHSGVQDKPARQINSSAITHHARAVHLGGFFIRSASL